MFKRLVIVLLVGMVLLSGCGAPTPDPLSASPVATEAPLIKIRLPMGYIPSVQYAPFYVAVEKGYFREAGIEIEFDYSFETDGVALVGANNLQFALVSAEQVLLARAQGLPVVYVLNWWRDYPVSVVAKKESGIRTPQDLAGKKIGLPGLFGANYIGLRALLSAGGVAESDVTLDSIGFNQVEALVGGQDDAVVVYSNNEPIQLRARGIEIDEIKVADFAHLASNGLITNETTLANNPDLVRGMNRAILRGVADTLADPAAAFQICTQYVEGLVDADRAVQDQILATSSSFWQGEQPGYNDPQAWENMQTVLLQMGLLKESIDLSRAYSNDYLK